MHDAFLWFSAAKLDQLAERIEACTRKLSYHQIWWRGADAQNSIGNLILHLSGNVRQWIVSGVGGEVDARRRDAEFAARGGLDAEELTADLRRAVNRAAEVIGGLSQQRLTERIKVQGYDVTVLEAVYHVVEHFAQHTGQIVYATKLLTTEDLGFYKHLSDTAHGEPIP